MFRLRPKFHINELIRILQTKIHGVLQFHDRYIGGLVLLLYEKKKANKVQEGRLLYRRSVFNVCVTNLTESLAMLKKYMISRSQKENPKYRPQSDRTKIKI